MSEIVVVSESIMVDPKSSRDAKSQLRAYARWIDQEGILWFRPDLAAYRDYLLEVRKLSSASAQAHLSHIRRRYKDLLKDRDRLYSLIPQDVDIPTAKAMVDELVIRIENAIDPDTAKIKQKKVQDESDLTHIRLSEQQADTLLRAPGLTDLTGWRNTAMITLMLCTGVREAELTDITVNDLKQRLGGELSLQVLEGKGKKQRLIPYGELEWCVAFVDQWLTLAGIQEGYVFRRILRGGKTIGKDKLTTRSIEKILSQYPIYHEGRPVPVRPHDLRRTYARRLYECGLDPVRIQQNLGHTDLKTTLGYIGNIDASKRRPPSVYKTPNDILQRISGKLIW